MDDERDDGLPLPDEATAYHLYRAIECLSEKPGRFLEVMGPYIKCLTRLEEYAEGLFDPAYDRQKRRDLLSDFLNHRVKDSRMRSEICRRISLAYHANKGGGTRAT